MGVQLFANGAAATLSGTLAQGGTTMTLAAGTGAKFPSITGSDYFYVTLFTKDAFAVEQNIEVVKVTARTGDTLTLVRDIETMTGQSGGFAYDGNATTVYVQQRNTAKTMDNMLQKSGNLSGLADNAAARTNLGLGTAAPLNVPISGNAAPGEVVKGSDTRLSDARTPTAHNQAASTISDSTPVGRSVLTATDAATARSAIGAAPTDSPAFTTNVSTPAINGAATSGFKNKIINGCCRISRKGSGGAALGWNVLGADGIYTFIGGWSAVTGNINSQSSADSSVSSSGGTHLTNITAATGSAGYINHIVRIEAADALELAGKPITTSARIMPLTKQIDDVVIYIMKANTLNNFGAGTYVANSAGLGPVSANTVKDVSFSTTLTTADCANGLQIEIHCYYNSAVTAAFHCVIADLQCCAGSQRMPFELRPIAIEEELRSRYYRKQSVWVGVTGARTCFPIGMVKTPTITGGGTGFTSTGTTADTLMCYQTTAAAQTLILDAEL